MFNNLIASDKKKRRRFWNPGTVAIAVIIHALLIAGAVHISARKMKNNQEKKPKELVTYVEVPEPPPPEPKEPPPPEPEPPPPQPEAPVPKGFQELKSPVVIPTELPSVDLSASSVNPEDFSGLGVAGGRADGDPDATLSQYKIFRVVEQMPELVGGMQAAYDAIEYPDRARQAGIEGTVIVQFTVDENGNITDPKIIRSPHELLGEAVLRALDEIKFTPGKQRGRPVKVRMSIPIHFRLK